MFGLTFQGMLLHVWSNTTMSVSIALPASNQTVAARSEVAGHEGTSFAPRDLRDTLLGPRIGKMRVILYLEVSRKGRQGHIIAEKARRRLNAAPGSGSTKTEFVVIVVVVVVLCRYVA